VPTKHRRPTAPERLRIAERSGRAIRSVDRAYTPGTRQQDATVESIARAARELDLPLPLALAESKERLG
jgi:hypothetical protein